MRSNPQELRRRRQIEGHTESSLARASGVSQQRISDLEAAALPVRPPTAKALATALRCDVEDITGVADVVEASA